MKYLKSPLLLMFVIWTVLAGCDSIGASDAEETVPVTLSLSVSNGDLASSAVPGVAAGDFAFADATGGAFFAAKSGHVEITSARLLVRSIKLHARDDDDSGDEDNSGDGDDTGDSDDSDDSDDDGEEFRTDIMVIEFDPTSLFATEIDVADIPLGTYHKMSFDIHKPDSSDVLEGDEFDGFIEGESGDERFSIIITGMYDGAEFTYKSRKHYQQKINFDPDLEIDGTATEPLNISLDVDLSKWFVGRDGEDLDPTAIDNRTRNAIDKSIRDSFRLFPDRDRDGRPENPGSQGSQNGNRGNGNGNGNGNAGGNGNSGGNRPG